VCVQTAVPTPFCSVGFIRWGGVLHRLCCVAAWHVQGLETPCCLYSDEYILRLLGTEHVSSSSTCGGNTELVGLRRCHGACGLGQCMLLCSAVPSHCMHNETLSWGLCGEAIHVVQRVLCTTWHEQHVVVCGSSIVPSAGAESIWDRGGLGAMNVH
jgi:hypothetical protein